MGLFALSLLVGGLVAVVDQAHPAIRRTLLAWRPKNVALFILITGLFIIGSAVGYIILWLHYYDVRAPSHQFRIFYLIMSAIQFFPLMLATAAVGFEAFRWIRRLTRPGQAHIAPHGIGVGAAALFMLGLFIMQDERLLGWIRSVQTPVMSVEFNLAEPAQPPQSLGFNPATANLSGPAVDPIMQTLSLLGGLPGTIERDINYAKSLSRGGELPIKAAENLKRDVEAYKEFLEPLANCLIALRQRIKDKDPLVFMEKDIGRDLRHAHRLLLGGRRPEFRDAWGKFVGERLSNVFNIIDQRYREHDPIEPVFDERSNLDVCKTVRGNWNTIEPMDKGIRRRIDDGALSSESPYLTLIVAALLNMMNEKLAAVEEIDAWLKHQSERPSPKQPVALMLERIMAMRAHFVAGLWLASDPGLAAASIRRLRRAIDIIEDTFVQSKAEHIEHGITLAVLFDGMNSTKDEWGKADSLCRKLHPDLGRLAYSALSIINTAMYYAVSYDILVLDVDPKKFVRDYHETLGFIAPSCFDRINLPSERLKADFAAFTDTYLFTKLTLLRQLPADRVRAEMCKVAIVVDRAQDHMMRLEDEGRAYLKKKDDRSAEEQFALARALKRNIVSFNEMVQRVGPRAC